tara:strand:- start:797 stop:1072 length:276 start_codon:yes stop_codon:yes gene_type:complete
MKVVKGKGNNSNNEDFKAKLSRNLEGLKLKDLDDVVCSECGNPTFIQVHLLRKISAVMSPNGKGGFLPVPIFQCANCGHINEELMPRESTD